MNFDETLRILQEAAGDQARLSLATIDLLLAGHPEGERARLREALEAAAVPHWFDDRILAALLEVPPEEAAGLAVRLRQLPVVELFSARGPRAANVHEKSRLALRALMKEQSREQLRVLSERARRAFAGEEPHLLIEALYHRFATEPEGAASECEQLFYRWNNAGRYEALLALGVALDELVLAGLPGALPRGVALYSLAKIRYNYQSRDVSAQQAADALAEFGKVDNPWQIASTQELLGDVELDRGDLESALGWHRRARSTREQLVAELPGDTARQGNLSTSYKRIGNVQSAQGDLPAALKSYRDSLAILEKLAKQDPGNAQWQRDLSASYDRVGDVERAQGDLPAALKSYRGSLAIIDKLAKQDPGNAEWQRDLSVSYNKVGDVERVQGDLPSALQSYRDSLAIRDKLAKQDPGNAQLQRDLSVSYDRVGDVERAQGDLPGALQSYRDSLAIRDKLVKQDPGNAQWQRDLAISYERIGLVAQREERWAEAAESFACEADIARPWLQKQDAEVAWLSIFVYGTGNCWEVLRDARKGAVTLDRAKVLADLRTASDRLRGLKEQNRLVPPMDEYLPWIEGLLDSAKAEAQPP